MQRTFQRLKCLAAAALVAGGICCSSPAKGYSSGGHSYSSHSSSSHSSSFSSGSHSFSSGSSHSSSSSSSGGGSSHSSSFSGSSGGSSHGSTFSWSGSKSSGSDSGSGSKSFNSGSGHSYTSGSLWDDSSRRSYSSGKSYGSGSGSTFFSNPSHSHDASPAPPPAAPQHTATAPATSQFSFDNAAARARKEEASKQDFARFNESQNPPRADGPARSYQVRPPPIPVSARSSYRPPIYIPEPGILVTRPARIYTVFNPYATRPYVVYHDPYNSLFWWWLLDRSLDDRAWWAYHHRYDMDPDRYQALLANDQQLQARVDQLESQQAPRDPAYVPAGIDRDLMYSDQYVARAYSNRSTPLGVVSFWALAVPMAAAVCAFFIWLIWFKRWTPAPQPA